MFDLIIANGTVIDGTGAPGIKSDVGIVGERIEAIDALVGAEARRVIDAKGLVVSPGFVDPHTHSEGDLLVDPQHAYGLRQGITTETPRLRRNLLCSTVPTQLPHVHTLARGDPGRNPETWT